MGSFTIGSATTEWPAFWQVRDYLVKYSGIVAMILMSLTVILSVRHWPLENWLRGLDQQYRLHKYLGISSAFMMLLHWLVFMSDDFAMDMGLIAAKAETFPFWALIDPLTDAAQFIGEWGFYLAAAFVLIAWIKFFPHRVFQLTHQLFPYLYLLLVLHMAMFFDTELWLSLPGIVLAITVALATAGCLLTILGLNGKKNTHLAEITNFQTINNGVEVTVQSDGFSYQPGQFALVTFDDKEGAHPFSLASPDSLDNQIRFLIKASGDYTKTLAESLQVGQSIEIEGPYGHFNFNDNAQQHIWIAGGIGIAPFLTAIETIGSGKKVDLFYSYRESDERLLQELKDRAAQSGVQLHLIDTNSMPRLRDQVVLESVKNISDCSVWYCGPLGLGEHFERGFRQAKLPVGRFHRELFNFR
ncbi:MAG: ferredoxin reductase family protein [Thiolinea sp.]